MSQTNPTAGPSQGHNPAPTGQQHARQPVQGATGDRRPRQTTETKASTKTTELIAYVAAVVAVIVTAFVVGEDANDSFGGSEAMRYVVYLTIGYMLARGLAKSGSRDTYDA